MKVDLSEKIVSGLQDIQENYEGIDIALQILEEFVYESDEGTMDAKEGLYRFDALRNIRFLRKKISILYSEDEE